MIIWQAIKKHEFVHVLDSPGDADLSAYVDFDALKHVVKESARESRCLPDQFGFINWCNSMKLGRILI